MLESLWSVPVRVVLFVAGLVATFLPRSAEMRAGPLLGRLVLSLGLFKRRTAYDNIRRCFPELGEEGWSRLLRANFEHYGVLFFEFLHFFSPFEGHYRDYAARISRLEGVEHWKAAREKGKGVLFVSSHVGFWEMSAAAAGLAGLEPTVVTTVLKPRWLHDRITACRKSCGVTAAYHPGSIPGVLRALRKNACAAFMNDQYAHPPMGMPARFFGVRVNTLAAVAPLAKRTGAAVVPVSVHRDAEGINHVVIEPELDLSSAGDDVGAATEKIAACVERWVRRHPEQWLWMHRRFKNVDWNDRLPAPAAAAAP